MQHTSFTDAISANAQAWLNGEITAREWGVLEATDDLARERRHYAECKAKRLPKMTDYHRRRMLRAYLEIRAARKWQ